MKQGRRQVLAFNGILVWLGISVGSRKSAYASTLLDDRIWVR